MPSIVTRGSTTMKDHILDENGTQLAWIEKDEVFSAITENRIALARGRELFSLQGERLNLHLQETGAVRDEGDVTPAVFMQLLK